MSQKAITNIFSASLKSLLKNVFQLVAIGVAWLMKAGGLILSKTGETIERIIIKKSQ